MKITKSELKTELIQIRATKQVKKMLSEMAKADSRSITRELEYFIKINYECFKKGEK